MSTIIMSACWLLQDMSPAQKAVLVSLADQSNDEGYCWPSVAYMAMRTCLSERAVQNAIKSLIKSGAISIKERKGRSTVYCVTPAEYAPLGKSDPRRKCTPAGNAPPQEMRGAPDAPAPAPNAPPPPQHVHPTPADAAPITVIEPSVESSPKRGGPPEPSAQNDSSPPAEPSPTSRTGSRLPSHWVLPKAWGEWALQERPDWTAEQVRAVAAKFKDHWIAKAGKDARKADWAATWRNWVRGESVSGPRQTSGAQGGKGEKPWMCTWSGIVAKGAELGVEQGPDETSPAFKARVFVAAQVTEEDRARILADYGVRI